MNFEENRLQTFTSWPTNSVIDPSRVAKAGFYYTGCAQEVQCFLCGKKVSDWNYGDQAIVKHRQVSPDCPFVIDPVNTCNIPLITGSSNANLPSTSATTNSSETRIVDVNYSIKEFMYYENRLRTFEKWPSSSIVPPEKLAMSGFIYLQSDDLVECTFCKGILMKWQPGDDPDTEHRKHFPSCTFYIYQTAIQEGKILENVQLISGIKNLDTLGIALHKSPRKSTHTTYEGRLRTFSNWPENLKQTPEMLAEAGFCYCGEGDQVRCFHCDGGLKNWEETDNVWVEHAKYFPKCGFVILVQGHDFIKKCCDDRVPDPTIFAGTSGELDKSANPNSTPPRDLVEVTDSVVDEIMSSDLALKALEIGLEAHRVRSAIKIHLQSKGTAHETSLQLIEDVLSKRLSEKEDKRDSGNENCADPCEKSGENEAIAENSEKPETCNTPKQNVSTEKKLLEENRKLKEARQCKICMDREVGVVFLPCGHLAICFYCAPSLKHCPLCRKEIRATVRSFLS